MTRPLRHVVALEVVAELLGELGARSSPSRTATKTVFSPAIVPATSCERRVVDRVGERRRRSRAASWITSSWPVGVIPPAQRRSADGELLEPVEVGGAGQRVDEPAVAVPHLHEPELRDVARDGRLHGVDALARAAPRRARPASRAAAARRAAGSRPAARSFVVTPSTSRRSSIARSASSAEIVSGGVRRSAVSPAVPTSRPCSSAACATGRGRAAELDREQEAGAAHAVERGLEARADLADVGEQVVVDRVDDRAGRGARDGVAAEGRGVVAGDEAARRAVGDEQRADRQAVREPLRERDARRAGRRARCQA